MTAKQDILQILGSSGRPLKAKEIAAVLSRRRGYRVMRAEVNRLLYSMKSSGNVFKDESHQWHVVDRTGDTKRASPPGQGEPTPQAPTYYDILQVSRHAHPHVIQKAYKALVNLYHPDRADRSKREEFEERLKLINLAYGVLSDPVKRKQYDEGVSN